MASFVTRAALALGTIVAKKGIEKTIGTDNHNTILNDVSCLLSENIFPVPYYCKKSISFSERSISYGRKQTNSDITTLL